MDSFTKEFVQFWNREFESNCFIHPDDQKQANDKYVAHRGSIESFRRKDFFGPESKKKIHSSLVPIPYNGCLSRADIFLLMLNPGAKPVDYYAEYCDSSYRSRRLANLRQDFEGVEFPLIGLDPKFLWASAYWSIKFREIAEVIAEKQTRSYLTALRELANRVAIIQLVAYHSKASPAVKRLASSERARRFVQKGLVPRAERGDIALVVMRGKKYWEIEENKDKHPNIVVYEGAETRAASLDSESRGGRAVIAWLREHRR